MRRKLLALAGLLSTALFSQAASAQGLFWNDPANDSRYQYSSYAGQQYASYGGQGQYGYYGSQGQYGYYGSQAQPEYLDPRLRPQASPIPRQLVDFDTRYAPGTIVISTEERRLYYVTRRGEAIQYAVGDIEKHGERALIQGEVKLLLLFFHTHLKFPCRRPARCR